MVCQGDFKICRKDYENIVSISDKFTHSKLIDYSRLITITHCKLWVLINDCFTFNATHLLQTRVFASQWGKKHRNEWVNAGKDKTVKAINNKSRPARLHRPQSNWNDSSANCDNIQKDSIQYTHTEQLLYTMREKKGCCFLSITFTWKYFHNFWHKLSWIHLFYISAQMSCGTG